MCANWNILTAFENAGSDFDPFQIFEVAHESCQVLQVTVLRGDNITMGKTRDMLDTPDPYVVLSVPGTNGGSQRTPCVDNCVNPVWNQQFEFLYDAELNDILEISLVDANIVVDYVIGVVKVDISDLKLDEETQIRIQFGEESAVHLRLRRAVNDSSDLRFSLALCDEEKQFRRDRIQRCMNAMNACFGADAELTSPAKTPVVAMLGSGGGFRAMIALCGVFKALKDSGILEMCMYIAGLSGSTWFVSQLYTHPSFPDVPTDEVLAYFRQRTGLGLLSHLGTGTFMRYMNTLVGKSVRGQPVSFTDFFGMLLRDTIVHNKDATLSDMRHALQGGAAPMPLFTSLHVKKNVSAKVFQEWVEFSPFEIGIPKYGTFMDTSKFGSRFFKGKISKSFPEYPLHFLQGIWGSAFTILFKRLVDKDVDDQQRSLGQEAEIQNLRDLEESVDDEDIDADECNGLPDDPRCQAEEEEVDGPTGADSDRARRINSFWKKEKEQHDRALKQKKMTVWERMMSSELLNSRAGRAGAIFNPLYGLRLLHLHPISPFSDTEDDETDFARIHEMMDTTSERLLLVDAGLTFNSPYPVLLRPQRGVDLYISFDFSGREEDEKDLFEELLLAETWARKNKIPFPNVKEQAREFEVEPLREVYVFRGDNCPTIMHFVLVNTTFRKFKAPGVPRETKEELEFGDFSVFSGGQEAFCTMNFCYSTKDFDRLSQLAEYNTRVNLDLIKAEILRAIRAKQLATRMSLKEVVRLRIMSQKSRDAFISLVRQMQQGARAAPPPGSPSPSPSRPTSGSSSADRAGKAGPSQLERFVSALDLAPEGEERTDGGPRPHRPAERFVSAEDVGDLAPPRPGGSTER